MTARAAGRAGVEYSGTEGPAAALKMAPARALLLKGTGRGGLEVVPLWGTVDGGPLLIKTLPEVRHPSLGGPARLL